MGKSLVFKETYFTHETADGTVYEARPMPVEFIDPNKVLDGSTGIRVYMIDKNEKRKFINIPKEVGVFMSDEGEQGYVGYYDYYIESDNSVTSGMFYVHPFHRNRGLVRNLITFLEAINEGKIIYNNLSFSNLHVARVVNEVDKSNAIVRRDIPN